MKYSLSIKRITAGIMAFLLVCLFLVPEIKIRARDSFLSGYQQTVYNHQNGLDSSEVNCVYQSSSGYLWVGTDSGLYRSKGAEFQRLNLWDTERSEVYVINCIIQDSHGRMWIGTDNYGLFMIENSEVIHFKDEYYDGIKEIHSICEAADGTVYIAAADGLFTVEINAEGIYNLINYVDNAVSGMNFSKIVAVENDIWALLGANSIFVLGTDSYKGVINTSDIISDELNCMCVIEDKVYVGSTGRDIIIFSSATNQEVITTGVEKINTFMLDRNGRLFVGADSGIGYFYDDNFIKLQDCYVDSYISDAIQDYEGNYWFGSTRMGVLMLSRNKFRDFNMQTGMNTTMVNAVYLKDGNKYICTEEGLLIYDEKNMAVSNELTEYLNDVSVRNIMCAKNQDMWISTYRRYGLVRLSRKGEITSFGRLNGLPSSVINCAIELNDGNIAVATDSGIGIINNDNVIKTYGSENGMDEVNITCLYQMENGLLYAGTDGSGLYIIDLVSDKLETVNDESGLNSNSISTIKEGKEGIWISTDNGLCFYKESFRTISNIEYTNNVYDIVMHGDKVILIGSMGILLTTETELLGSKGISGRYYNTDDGLTKTLNNISSSDISEDGRLYLCCNTGVCTLDTENIPINTTPPKMRVTSVDVDGKTYQFDDLAGSLKVPSGVSRITIDFDVFSYMNRSNIQVEYYLEGFDDEPIVINGNEPMRAVYTNLAGGVYEFVIKAYNGDGTECDNSVSFVIEKENSFFENDWAKLIVIAVIVLVLAILVVVFLKVLKVLKARNTELEKLSREHEEVIKQSSAKNDYFANMSNEIKTPINAMVSKADELIRLMSSDDEKLELARNIYNTGNDIIEKVDDIILLARIEAEKVNIINTPYSVSQLVYDLSEEYSGRIADKPIKFFVEIADDMQENLVGDINKIKDIVSRLLDNAIKYTKEGSITLSVDSYMYNDKTHHDMVNMIISVSDTGIGIQDTKLENLFEATNLADNVKESNSGIGVGLAIAKGYANLLDAELEAESIYGAGSNFTFSINQRIASSSTAANLMTKIEGRVSKEEAEQLYLPDVKVLVVDDEDVSREVACKTLEKFEIKTDAAASGLGAIDMVLNGDYDVIFMDISMPVMSGIDAMKEIRELNGEGYAYLPIIAMNTDAIEENKDELLGAGFTDSLLKPIEMRRVAAILKDCLPQDKIKERANEIDEFDLGARYKDGIEKLGSLLDAYAALDKIGGSIEVYNKLIKIFYNQNKNAAKELKEKHQKDVRGFKAKIHSIRTNSINIGATALAKETAKMEAAINIGNRDYIRNNIEEVTWQLKELLTLIEEYMNFVETVKDMTDEDYLSNKRLLEENKVSEKSEDEKLKEASAEPTTIDIMRLENIKYTALDGEYDAVMEELAILEQKEYTGEDKEFMEVLKKTINKKDIAALDELITTYIDLKM